MQNRETPLLSIIIPAYNAANTLRKCVDSALDQDNAPIEIIISNDGSVDDTQAIIAEYIAKDNRVIGVTDSNGGLSCARNRGIRAARGAYITFLDADDYVAPGIYLQITKVLNEHKPDMLDYQYFVHNSNNDYPAPPSLLPKDTLLSQKWISDTILPVLLNISPQMDYFIQNFVWNKVYRAGIMKAHNVLFDENRRKWEDRLFSITFLQYANSYYSMSEYGYYYVCGNAQSLSGSYSAEILKIIMDSYHKYRQMYGEIYNFDNPYTVNYFCRLLIDVAREQFSHHVPESELMTLFSYLTESDTVRKLFQVCTLSEPGMMMACGHIRNRDKKALYDTLQKQYYQLEHQKKQKAIMARIRTALSRIKRMISK